MHHQAFKITDYLQSMICYLSQGAVFEEASNILSKMVNLEISAKQSQLVSEYYGAQLDPIIEANHTEYISQLTTSNNKDEVSYVMVDGCMLYTREEEWKENKLARIFNSSKNISVQENRNEVVENVYVSHLGGVDKFLPKLEMHLGLVKNKKVFIADGAAGIWKWIEDNYPGSEQIIDFYHAVEKIAVLAKSHFKNEVEKLQLLERQKAHLMKDEVHIVIRNVEGLRTRNEQSNQAKQNAIRYYEEHEDKMIYMTYREKGYLIGSGPIESAHRNVIQK